MPSASQPANLHIASLVRLACKDLRVANALYEIAHRSMAKLRRRQRPGEGSVPVVATSVSVLAALETGRRRRPRSQG
jgi:hypothetical protein